MAKKTTTATTAKVAPAAKVETKVEVKAAPVAKEAAVEVKETVKKEAVKAEPAKKAPAKKTATKTTATKATATKTATTKKTVKTTVTVQFGGQEVSMDAVVENVKKAFEAEGNKVSAIKDLQVYVKPEEYAAYYVINQDITGKVNLF